MSRSASPAGTSARLDGEPESDPGDPGAPGGPGGKERPTEAAPRPATADGLRGLVAEHPASAIFLLVLGLWGVLLARSGSGLAVGAEEYLSRVVAFPDLVVTGESIDDYQNWSILPIAIAKALGVETLTAFAALQVATLVLGSAVALAWVGRRDLAVGTAATLGLFATVAPAYVLHFVGNYDQLLLVLLVVVAVAERSWVGALAGLLAGLTNAELAGVALGCVLVLAWAGVGRATRPKVLALAGVVVGRCALWIWIAGGGQSSDRFVFIEEFGVRRLLRSFADVWPLVVWSLFGAGWILVLTCAAGARRRRAAALTVVVLAGLGVAAFTVDHSRVAMLTMVPSIIVIAMHLAAGGVARDTVGGGPLRPIALAAGVGLLVPVTTAWAGASMIFGDPFSVHW